MSTIDLPRMRLVAQGLIATRHERVSDVVAEFGAMQGQDLPGLISSIALRTHDGGTEAVLAAFDAGEVVRAYPMRGTVFAVAAGDAIWMTELCAAAALRSAVKRRVQLGLTGTQTDRARDVAVETLSAVPSGLSRADMVSAWNEAGIETGGGVGYHLLSEFIQEALLSWGPWNGKDQNVVLNGAWLPGALSLEQRFNGDRVAATAELLSRYLTSHGPATVRDFAWWTKLPLGVIRRALPMIVADFETDGGDEAHYWRPGLAEEVETLRSDVDEPRLLPGFDELVLGYPDRLYLMTADQEKLLTPGRNGVFKRTALADGRVRGLWNRSGRPGKRGLEIEPFGKVLVRHRKGWDKRFAVFPFHAE